MRGKYKPKSRNLQQKVRGTGFLIIFARKSTPNAMKPETVCTVVFSPTGTSKKIAETVARSIASDAGTEAAALKTIDLTHAAAHSAALSAGAVAVIAAPVYGGHVAPTAAKRLETLRKGRRGAGRARRPAGIRPRGRSSIRRRALVQHPRNPRRRRTPRRAGPRPGRGVRRRGAQKTRGGNACPGRRRKTEGRAHAARADAALHPFRRGLPPPAEEKPGRLPARMRCRPLHPLRPLRRDLPDAGHRAGRRGAHRPCALYPLLRLRQGLSGRSTEFPHPLRRSPRTQLHPAQTTRNDLIIMIERLASPTAHELDALTDLWERSVRAPHDFLAPEDIPFFRRMVRQEALPAAEIYVIRDSGNGFAAFAGIGADRLEMLFVAPSARGKGLGRELVEHVAVHCGVRRVDVNEQNAQAAGFYARMGFRIVSRDALDPSGRPYPILHLER